MENANTDKIWNPIFISVFITNFCITMGQNMMNTLITKFAYSLGAAAGVVGMVASMFTITALAVRPFSSPAFDSFSKKKLLIICLVDVMIAFVIYGCAHNVSTIIVARLIQGIGHGCITPLCLAMAGDSLPPDKLGSGIGVYMIGNSISQAVGPNIGLNLSQALGFNKTFFIGVGVMCIGLIACFRLKEAPRELQPYKIRLNTIIAKEAIPYSLLLMMLNIAVSSISSFLAIYAGLRNVANIGFYFTVNAVSLLVIRPFAGRISDKYGFDKVILPGIVFFACAFLLISRSTTLPMFLLAAVIAAFGYGIAFPAIQSVSLKKVPVHKRGAGTSTNYIFIDIAMLAGPLIGGAVVEASMARGVSEVLSYAGVYKAMIIPMAIAFVYSLIIRKDLVGFDRR
ncbi:MAG: MFS transporter [Eubacterium sp.]|nr:MFS transporter [Eubacterium sp.]